MRTSIGVVIATLRDSDDGGGGGGGGRGGGRGGGDGGVSTAVRFQTGSIELSSPAAGGEGGIFEV